MTPARSAVEPKALRVGTTPAILHTQHGLLADWRRYMEGRLNRPVEIVQRNSYQDAMELLRSEQVDMAWICSYPYVHLRKQVRLLAVPLYRSQPYYRAYLIVSARHPEYQSLYQMRRKIFAYTDPYSFTGYVFPRYQLRKMGEDPAKFFAKTFFTYSHDKLIEAVADGLALGGSVDGYVWDSLDAVKPEITRRTLVANKSAEFGFPPLVARRNLPEADFSAIQAMLLAMRDDRQGKELLQRLNLDGFIHGNPDLYNGVAEMMRASGEG
jgi:phosphonate transport system substrate-binding protein